MSLIVWMPLIKDIRNQGLVSGSSMYNGGTASFTTGGKLGNCYTYKSGTFPCSPAITLTTEATIMGWVKTSSSGGMLFGMASNANSNLNIYQSNELCLNIGDSSDNPFKDSSGNRCAVITDGVWHHLAFVFSGSNKCKYYKDGVYQGEATTYRNPTASSKIWSIGGAYGLGTSYITNGLFCDFRVYNHACTALEVKEVSKALIGGWLGNDWQVLRSKCSSVTWNQLNTNGDFSDGTTGYGGYGSDTLTASDNTLHIATSAENSAKRISKTVSWNSSHIYIVRYYIRATSNVTRSTAFYNGSAWSDSYNYTLNWTKITIRHSGANLFGLGYDRGNLVTDGSSCCDIKDICVFDLTAMFGSGSEPTNDDFNTMFPLHYYPYDSGTTKDLRLPIPDALSGLHNDLTVNGTVSLSSDTKRYDRSIQLGSGYLTPLWPSFLTDSMTLSFWVKLDKLPDSSPGRSMLYTSWFGFSCEVTSGGSTYFRTCLTSGSCDSPSGTIAAGSWYHWVGVKSPTGVSLYLNGNLVGTTNNSNSFRWSLNSNAIGRYGDSYYTYGKMSDIRLYATALSADDILELYKLGN